MNNRLSRDDMMTAISVIISKRSTCQRLQVGAVIALDGRILSTGYAGAPSGFAHCKENKCDLTLPCTRTIHAEMNCITFAARHGVRIDGATLYTTHSPCYDCAKAIINAGILRVVYLEEYRVKDPIFLLQDAGIQVQRSSFPSYLDYAEKSEL
jgi:dCMP deaminase